MTDICEQPETDTYIIMSTHINNSWQLEIRESLRQLFLYLYNYDKQYKNHSKYHIHIYNFVERLIVDSSIFINDLPRKPNKNKYIFMQKIIYQQITLILCSIEREYKNTIDTIYLLENMNNSNFKKMIDECISNFSNNIYVNNILEFDNIALFLEYYDLKLLSNFRYYLQIFIEIFEKNSNTIINSISD